MGFDSFHGPYPYPKYIDLIRVYHLQYSLYIYTIIRPQLSHLSRSSFTFI
ncbi:hypothetical protein HanRHA438_Chr03g0124091 [Helianthus annuus]|nr:hypothetical protein HanHA300_Chr03g0093451 [Helianthus annuus]KAJ0600906.1 hypothetical protein HanIR_Chr03g0122411 [Helianthus annuus]KAJ0608125.1 hypothetical protein HanHA89_Chr03g0105141 [Helianthus annuus]KAJ0768192.1 hypothetical protein HanLR1_Chr03g0098531 [Helianthus annuus]KAJ0935839.1 hypothetical protein HanRHA438_Chr03g0124091 [Helianthus annuus]